MNYIDVCKENRSSSYKKSIEAARKALNSLSFNRLPARHSPQPVDKNPKHVSEYSREIIQNLKQEELLYEAEKDFMKHQPDITSNSRAILINWLVSVHRYLKLLLETFYIAISLVDRFLQKKSVTKYQLQLLGISALFLASKYEEIYPPEFSKFLKVCENAYTKAQIVLMEKEILKALDFKLTVPTPWVFYQKFSESASLHHVEHNLGQYLIELTTLDMSMIRYRSSLKAAAAVLISQKHFKKDSIWRLQQITGYAESELKECIHEMMATLQLARFNPLKAIREKYSSQDYDSVSVN
ncbi:hypothetical protein SteCoe_28660 [Stentor coeruleus]|uniref:Uncharacterized protein n=1 Tax=Stentor coeruleus TaxID=5963 RepID=A0A1R2B892_9CILI|nr:hypothetical protein SteCoe_28660 [Stentor coeruleus]